MQSSGLFIAFGAVMLVIALLAVGIDWLGKPLRHRRFVPKIYRFPDERTPRRSKVRETAWSDGSFVLPVAQPTLDERMVRYPDQAPAPQMLLDPGPPTTQVPLSDLPAAEPAAEPEVPITIVTLEDLDPNTVLDPETEPEVDAEPAAPPAPAREHGWSPGDYVFNFTSDGSEPSPTTVRTRYWKNVAATAGAALFGAPNMDRMGVGKPPQRRNPRTGAIETMRLPQASYHATNGATPLPEWPCAEIDPFDQGATS